MTDWSVACTTLECLFPATDAVETDADRRTFNGRRAMQDIIAMASRKNIALVAHDNKKEELVAWAKFNCRVLAEHSLCSTRTTGELLRNRLGLNVTLLESGALGGDQQIGSRITEGQIDFVIFFLDPLQSQPHDDDVKALLRITVVWNVPLACNRASAYFLISSPLMTTGYKRVFPNHSKHRARLRVGSHSKLAAKGAVESPRQRRHLGVHEMDGEEVA